MLFNQNNKTIVDRKIRFAVIGCGRIANSHFEALKKHADRAELVAVCDVDHGVLETIVASTGAVGYTCYKTLLKEAGVDIVALCTPSGLHSMQAVQAAEAGVHVMTEKPMATRWQDGQKNGDCL